MQINNIPNEELTSPYTYFKEDLDKFPFILIIGKYDHLLGPRALYSSIHLRDEKFIRNLLRDALNTKNQFVILDFNLFYSQVYKIEVEDPTARGKKQLYALILLRDIDYPLIPILHFKRIEMIFHKIGHDKILPLESINMQIRSGVNTIQGFCELIIEQKRSRKVSEQDLTIYIEMMLDSCKEIIEALEKPKASTIN
jgi:hypothetical protein